MGFEIFNRKVQWGGSPAVAFTKLGRFAFNKAASGQLEKAAVENVLLMWDKEQRLIGVRPITKKDNRAYKLHWGKRGDGCGFSAATFLKYIGYDTSETRSLPAQWDEQEQIYKIEVPEVYLRKGSIASKKKKETT
jgi:hypothetical protein